MNKKRKLFMILGACKIMNVFRIWEFSTKQYFSYLAVGNICHTPHSGTVSHHCNDKDKGRKIKEKGLKMFQQFNVINVHQANGNPCKLTFIQCLPMDPLVVVQCWQLLEASPTFSTFVSKSASNKLFIKGDIECIFYSSLRFLICVII